MNCDGGVLSALLLRARFPPSEARHVKTRNPFYVME